MALECSKCKQNISSNKQMLVCNLCKECYHLNCTTVSESRFFNTFTGEHRINWKCDICMKNDTHILTRSPKTTTTTQNECTPTHKSPQIINVSTENSFQSLSIAYLTRALSFTRSTRLLTYKQCLIESTYKYFKMNKCEKCAKNITKKIPGLECSRCEKIVHSNTQCSGLTNKQLTALRNTENLEWTCQECQNMSLKRGSLIFPDEEEDEEASISGSEKINVKKLLKDISSEVDKCVNRALRDIHTSLQYQSNKVDEVLVNMDALRQTIQDLQRKNTDLTNKNKNLETRVGALEQNLHLLEQEKLASHVEIANIPLKDSNNVQDIVKRVATILEQPEHEVVNVKKVPAKKDASSIIQVQLKEEKVQEKWLIAAKTKKVFVNDIVPDTPHAIARQSIFVRELLSPFIKKLLWHAKQELKSIYKFIWCKKGTIMAKRHENEKSIVKIRSLDDVKSLLS